jgi:hypothetical protein
MLCVKHRMIYYGIAHWSPLALEMVAVLALCYKMVD